MPSWRISTLTSGTGSRLGGAALPIPAGDARAFQRNAPVSGSPGTTPIPAPAPIPIADRDATAMAQTGQIGIPSSQFSFWRPGVWYFARSGMTHAPVSVFSDNQMPVPAVDPRGLPGVVMPGPVMLGQRQVGNPRVAPKYLDANKNRYRSPNQQVFRG